MKKFLKKLLGGKTQEDLKEIKQFSSTTTDATEGSNAKRDLDPNIGPLIDLLKQGEQINNTQLNKLAQFYFNVGKIPNTFYKFNNIIQQDMVFEIEGVDTTTNEVNDIVSIHLSMKEVAFNVDISLRVSVKDLHEFLIPINQEA